EHGVMELTSGYVGDENLNHLGWELTAVAVRILNAIGAYRPSRNEGGALFLLIKSIRHVN
ncbi:MAG TPA: hypothetical protein VN042_00790, partial [Asticcacaulis sp.]|nr:hypothetical protein [Asticcacaulis sp.]